MTNKREPGYYWVKFHGKYKIAEWKDLGSDFFRWRMADTLSYWQDDAYDEIGSRISPEMKYTEEDMIEFGLHMLSRWDCTDNTTAKEDFDNWLKQRKDNP